ncbi:O-antigen polymerase [Caloramator sp. Dgby_cultured_2]|uniref:O-antigen polymerase n=1 Tax=Caloramator sp. Dgby_cultured_2 TaxID=3029174 RepID=UPI00237E3E59|nr:O-antigen polymerase [Caloramator sp. Dgby_cultured_2]WDU82028.1 O-antigen ligase [Caloramator sp. Dgby_cultured_2]
MMFERLMERKRFIISLGIYFVLLCYSYYYYFYVYQDYTYQVGYALNLNYLKLVEAIIFIFLLGLIYFYYDINKSIYLSFSFILYNLLFVPLSVFYWMSDNARAYFYMVVISFIILHVIFLIYKINIRKERIYSSNALYLYLLVATFIVFAIINILAYVKYGNSLYYLFNLEKVYDIRFKSRDILPGYLKYILQWSALVVIPASIAYFAKIRRYYLIVIPLIVQALIFTINGSKFYLFSLIINLFVFLIYSEKLMYYMLPALNLFITSVLLLKNNFIMSVGIRRAFFVPQSLSFVYYDFLQSIQNFIYPVAF